ncbi:hypothetical protein CIC46_10185 [Listeria monocytogenes]|nr:hypothetical protein [Listeria monocytogenes]
MNIYSKLIPLVLNQGQNLLKILVIILFTVTFFTDQTKMFLNVVIPLLPQSFIEIIKAIYSKEQLIPVYSFLLLLLFFDLIWNLLLLFIENPLDPRLLDSFGELIFLSEAIIFFTTLIINKLTPISEHIKIKPHDLYNIYSTQNNTYAGFLRAISTLFEFMLIFTSLAPFILIFFKITHANIKLRYKALLVIIYISFIGYLAKKIGVA